MVEIVRGTTPTLVFTFPAGTLLGVQDIVLSISQVTRRQTKSGLREAIDGNTLTVTLTQQDTLFFAEGVAEMQLNWIYTNGHRAASVVITCTYSRNLHAEVMGA